jgi:hypothetical protein
LPWLPSMLKVVQQNIFEGLQQAWAKVQMSNGNHEFKGASKWWAFKISVLKRFPLEMSPEMSRSPQQWHLDSRLASRLPPMVNSQRLFSRGPHRGSSWELLMMVAKVTPRLSSWGALGDDQVPSHVEHAISFWWWLRSLLSWTFGKISTFAKVVHGLGSHEAFDDGQAPSQTELMGSSRQWPRSLPSLTRKKLSTMPKVPFEPYL